MAWVFEREQKETKRKEEEEEICDFAVQTPRMTKSQMPNAKEFPNARKAEKNPRDLQSRRVVIVVFSVFS